jgi:hypothetical protein
LNVTENDLIRVSAINIVQQNLSVQMSNNGGHSDGGNPSSPQGSTFIGSAFGILQQSIKAVPSVKYALGITGIAAAVAVIIGLLADVRLAIVGILLMFVFMVLLLVFARLSQLKAAHFHYPALFLMWAFVLLSVLWLLLITSSFFFDLPKSPAELFGTSPQIIPPPKKD